MISTSLRYVGLLLLVGVEVDDLHPAIRATLRADGMRQMHGVALGALDQVNGRQGVVGAAAVAASLRVLSFWQRGHK